jgi:hypothetical protein
MYRGNSAGCVEVLGEVAALNRARPRVGERGMCRVRDADSRMEAIALL